MPINPNDPLPIYKQLKQIILTKIENGDWKPGDYLPSEHELEQKYSISRTPVRQCLGELVDEGYLVKKKGKGTIVASRKKVTQDLPKLAGFGQDMKQKGLEPGYELVEITEDHLPTYAINRIDSTISNSLLVKRVMLADEEPMALHKSFLVPEKILDLRGKLKESLSNGASLYAFLRKYDIEIKEADQFMGGSKADKNQAELLNIEPGTPLLRMERYTYGLKNDLVEYVEGLYRSDRYEYHTKLVNK